MPNSSPARRRTVAWDVLLLGAATLAALAAAPLSRAAQTDTGASPAMVVTDETGRRVVVPQPVRRIVSLAPSLTETLYALGAGDRLVGDTDFCDYPPAAKLKPKVGGAINPNLEQIAALRPDLVLVTRNLNRRETVAALDQLKIPAYATDANTVTGMLDSVGRLAEVVGEAERGKTLVAELRARLERLKQRLESVPPRRVLFVVWTDPLISIGRHTFLADALRWADARSVVETRQDWPLLSLEAAVHLQPEFLIFAGSHEGGVVSSIAELRRRPGWRNLEAVQAGRIAVISDAINRPTPRMVDAIEQLARRLHPEVFSGQDERPAEDTFDSLSAKSRHGCSR